MEEKLILLFCKENINLGKIDNLASIDWDKLLKIANQQGILNLLYNKLNRLQIKNYIPEDIIIFLKRSYRETIFKNLVLTKEFIFILKKLKKYKIEALLFKGAILIYTLYKDIGLRSFSDIDILVDKKDIPKIKELILEEGYQEIKQKNTFLFIKFLNSNLIVPLEFHTEIVPSRPYRIKIPYLWKRAQEIVLFGERIKYLSYEDMFFALALHIRRHIRVLTLKFIIDIVEILNLNKDKMDWQYIYSLAKLNYTKNTIYFCLYISKELFDVEISKEIIDKFKPCYIIEKLVRLSINKNNFFKNYFLRGYFLRVLLFDNFLDIFLYLYRIICA